MDNLINPACCCSSCRARERLAAFSDIHGEIRPPWQDGRILDVDEFQVAKALLAGEVELLSQEVDSKHLFDLCLKFGHQSTAVAMISYGVPSCVFKGPRSLPPHASAPAG